MAQIAEKKQEISDNLIQIYRKFTLSELRLYHMYLSRIDPKDKASRYVMISLDEYANMAGIQVKVSDFRNICQKLLLHTITVPEMKGNENFPLFMVCSIIQNELVGARYFQLNVHDKALPLVIDFRKKYANFPVKNIVKLKSPYQIRMYSLLKQYETAGEFTITIRNLRESLGIKDTECTELKYFRRDLLNPVIRALGANTDLICNYRKKAVGPHGKWLSIMFKIECRKK